ncbi:MAG TPA: Crp/Fnr family transcriptional regulator [Dehalococcoidia bacterium]|nr:Crp/Fnr family transcriptional regulator [Dehalococcoidia bacterium]
MLLASLPPDDYKLVVATANVVELELKQIVHEPGESAPNVYFLSSGVVSLLTVLEDGSAVEIAAVGNEGMVDFGAFLGMEASARWLVQVPGSALRVSVLALRDAADHSPAILDALHNYMLAMFIQVSQTAACNRMHGVEERCARWLLMTHDRVDGDSFPMTHEFLADMLGVRRPSVSIAMGTLYKAGLINYHRGTVEILNRAGLERAACECYALLAAQFEHRLPTHPGHLN